MKVLVTGAAGRLGYKAVRLCTEQGYSVKAFDLPQVNWSTLEALGVETIKGDITNKANVKEACSRVDAVIHLAALLPPRTEQNRDLTQRINVEGTENILKSIEPETRMIFASSIATYGVTANEPPPIKESHKQAPHNIYAESKIQSEQSIKASGNPYTVLRIAPVSVADLLELPETVAYRADQRVECVYADDAAYALFKCLEEKKNHIYNIASGESWRMLGAEYMNRFYDALGVEVEPNYPEEYTAIDWYDTAQSK
ncbi:MAG: NAD(P)-dependent oxidoreductase, partial [Candidatus Bathyarchaeota archaeon]|nr:NAD(P)-dependent oxidoreductase [Candidatus Bathyarchaeota archaeon]